MSRICPTCHEMINDTQMICNHCGCPVPSGMKSLPIQQPINQNTKRTDFNGIKIVVSFLGIMNGILSIIFGAIIASGKDGTYVRTQSYGGDAYTGIQNAAALTAQNVNILIEKVKLFGGFLLIVLGIFIILLFAHKLVSTADKESEQM